MSSGTNQQQGNSNDNHRSSPSPPPSFDFVVTVNINNTEQQGLESNRNSSTNSNGNSSTNSNVGLLPDAEIVLSKAMMKLSLNDRNRFQEEIHGVCCLAPHETPDFLKESLRLLDLALNDPSVPICTKRAYHKCQEMFGNNKDSPTHVNTDEFRLRFLRCETFEVTIAAQRIFKYLDTVYELFGIVALQRPIRITDFSKEELRLFRKGRYQFLPYRDRAGTHGRRILSVFPDQEWQTMTSELRTKIWIYLTYVAGEDVEAQKSGLVVLVWFDKSWKYISKNPYGCMKSRRFITLGTRASSVHICTPDTPKYRFRRNALVRRTGKEISRVKIHVGLHPVELRYVLQSYGIPSDYIPISFTGTVKEKYIKEWIRLRHLIEEEQYKTGIYSNDYNNNTSCSMIESPYSMDIIFRNGTSLTSHPANAYLRSLIATKSRQKGNAHMKAKEFALDIMNEVNQQQQQQQEKANNNNSGDDSGGTRDERGHRFLIWNENGCYWKPVDPENEDKEIHKKIMRMVRGIRNIIANEKGEDSDGDEQGDLPKKRSRVSYRGSCEMSFSQC